jgi:hypothetical protein
MADSISDEADKAKKSLDFSPVLDANIAKLQQMADMLAKMAGTSSSGMRTMGGNEVNQSSGGGFAHGTSGNVNEKSGFASGIGESDPGFRNKYGENMQGIFGGLGTMFKGAATAAAMALPSPNESIYSELTSSRLKFYTNQKTMSETENLRFSRLGTPTSPLDAAYASNLGADVGLLPGLSNYFTPAVGGGGRYGGVMGGAALASNLTPGLGLQGGMAAMGSLNQASRVNMLRMIGLNVRGVGGTKMNSLPDIIARLYQILKAAGDVTPESIAVSAMSGNALDSMLNQYFGGDESLKQVVIAGLMQMAQTGGQNLNESGTTDALTKTGGTTSTASSLGVRSSRELQLIQKFTSSSTKGIRGANEALFNLYGGLIDNSSNTLLSGGSSLLSMAETFGGARNGAGAIFATSIFKGAGEIGGEIGSIAGKLSGKSLGGGIGADVLKSLVGVLGLGAGAIAADKLDYGNSYTSWLPKYGATKPQAMPNGLTMNVFANNTDPTSIANGISTSALFALARRS